MQTPTRQLFLQDAYLRECQSTVSNIDEHGRIILDESIFYATSGGQPGDSGRLISADGSQIRINTTIKDKVSGAIALVCEPGEPLPTPGDQVTCQINWEARHNLMRMHTACHLLSVICPLPITSANVGENESRIDFDMPQLPATKQELTQLLSDMIEADHPVYDEWIDEDELNNNPGLVKSKNVRPPKGVGKIRLVCIGENAVIDSQPCGGTHVKSTGEIGPIHIGKIEKKGKENRRFRIRFGKPPA